MAQKLYENGRRRENAAESGAVSALDRGTA
jgi:hypothetical protein